jgi:hypothetical protein
VPDLGLNSAAPSQEFCQYGRDAFAHAADQHSGARHMDVSGIMRGKCSTDI